MKIRVSDGYKTFVYSVDLEYERVEHDGDSCNKSSVDHRWTAIAVGWDLVIASATCASMDGAVYKLAADLQSKLVQERIDATQKLTEQRK